MKFEPKDFRFKRSYHDQDWDYENILLTISNIANAKFQEWLNQAPEVYTGKYIGEELENPRTAWSQEKFKADKYQAKLVCIEEIKK